MGSFGLGHWLVVLVIVLLLFGAGRLSDIGKGLGEGIKNFKKGLNDDDDAPPARIKTQELETTPAPKQLVSDPPKKKKVIQVEIDDCVQRLRCGTALQALRKRRAPSGILGLQRQQIRHGITTSLRPRASIRWPAAADDG